MKVNFRQQSIYIRDENSEALIQYMQAHSLDNVNDAINHLIKHKAKLSRAELIQKHTRKTS